MWLRRGDHDGAGHVPHRFDHAGWTWKACRYRPGVLSSRRSRRALGDASKARAKLGWAPKISLDALITEMLDADLERLRREPEVHAISYLKSAGKSNTTLLRERKPGRFRKLGTFMKFSQLRRMKIAQSKRPVASMPITGIEFLGFHASGATHAFIISSRRPAAFICRSSDK